MVLQFEKFQSPNVQHKQLMHTSKCFICSRSFPTKCVQKKIDWAKYHNRHISKSIWAIKLSFSQNDFPMAESFWQKDSLITHILFELCLLWHLSQSQIWCITLYHWNKDNWNSDIERNLTSCSFQGRASNCSGPLSKQFKNYFFISEYVINSKNNYTVNGFEKTLKYLCGKNQMGSISERS